MLLQSISDEVVYELVDTGAGAGAGAVERIEALSFDDLCVPLWEELVHYARKLAGDQSTAEDVVQDAFVRAFKFWPKWRPEGDPRQYARAWLFRIVLGEYIRHYNARSSRTRRARGSEAEIAAAVHAGLREPADAVEILTADEFSDEVGAAIASLPPERRTAIEAFYVRGLSCGQIADECGHPIGTVHQRLSRARTAVSRKLEPVASSLGLKQRRAG